MLCRLGLVLLVQVLLEPQLSPTQQLQPDCQVLLQVLPPLIAAQPEFQVLRQVLPSLLAAQPEVQVLGQILPPLLAAQPEFRVLRPRGLRLEEVPLLSRLRPAEQVPRVSRLQLRFVTRCSRFHRLLRPEVQVPQQLGRQRWHERLRWPRSFQLQTVYGFVPWEVSRCLLPRE